MKQFLVDIRGLIKRRVDALVIHFRRLPDLPCSACGGSIGKKSKVLVMGGSIVHNIPPCVIKRSQIDKRRYRHISAMPYRQAVALVLKLEAQDHEYEKSLFHG